jgi:hypothetical protein
MADPAPADPSDNSSARRLIVLAATFAAPFVAGILAKWGIVIPTEQLVAAMSAGVLYIGQSVVNSIHARSVEAATAIATTPAAAVADLNKAP